jgi:hypothetical protein
MTHVKTAVVIIFIAMLFAAVLSYASLMSTIDRARDDTQRVLDSFCIEKAETIYNSIKNGNKQMVSGTYTNDFMNKIAAELGLTCSGNTATHSAGSNVIFQYTNPLTANLHSDTLSLTTEFEVIVPLSFAGLRITDMRVPMIVESVFVLKFN